MKLLKAHINNFGKLQNLDIDFSNNINTFIHENGWGKTTLSVFIKAMLYGMEHTTSKDIDKNEKQKYLPWQGGIYGGSLEFSYNGKEYRVYREFNQKKGEDVFNLQDLKTNKLCNDFSENLGVEIFGINRETYSRSVYVVLNETPSGSVDISARLNNLIEADDIANFDTAYESLTKKSDELKAKRGSKGRLYQIQEVIDKDRNQLNEIKTKSIQNEEIEKKIAAVKETIDQLKQNQDRITEQLTISAKYENKIRYEQLQKDLANTESIKNDLLSFFDGKIPEPESIQKLDLIFSDYSTIESNLKNTSMTQSEKDNYELMKKDFGGDIPTKEQINICIKNDSEYKVFKQQESEKRLSESESEEYQKLNQVFGGKNISDADINRNISLVSEVQNSKSDISKYEIELQSKKKEIEIEQQNKPKNIKRLIFLLISGICLACSVVSFILSVNLLVTLVGVGLLVLFLILGLVSKNKKIDLSNKQLEVDELQNRIKNLIAESKQKESSYKSFISSFSLETGSELVVLTKISNNYNRYSILYLKEKQYRTWLENQPISKEEYENLLKVFVKRFCKTDDISNVPTELQRLNERLSTLYELERKVNNDSLNKEKQKETKEKLLLALSQYKLDKTLSFSEQVQSIHNKINDVKNFNEQINIAEQRIHEFEQNPENDVKSFATLVKPEKSVDELQDELAQCINDATENNRVIVSYQKIIDDNSILTEKKDDIEAEVERLTIEKKESEENYNVLQKTMDLLLKAKNNIDSNYSDPMKEGFSKYINMLGEKNLDLIIDTDLKVSIDSNGKIRDSGYLSDGYKDMVNFCSRMALVDALFQEVKPPVILDDPFVNLDDDKVPRALELVKEMSKDKQIIYFACHKSREIK